MMTTGAAERAPYRSRLDDPDLPPGSFRRGELAAGLAAAAVVAQCALAPVTLVVAGLLVVVGRISRWQLAWLLLPALGSACWLAVAGLPATAHAVAAGASRLMAADLAVGLHPGRLLHPAAVFAGSGRWLPKELPLLMLAGTAEAAVVLWSGTAMWPVRFRNPRSGWQPLARSMTPPARKSGPVTLLRWRASAAALAAGHTVTASGFAIGVDHYSGRLASVSWAQAGSGVLLAGGDPAELDQIGLAIACAAVRRRKAVLVLDLAAAGAAREPAWLDEHGAGVCFRVGMLAERLGVSATGTGAVADRGQPAAPGAAAVPGARTSGAVSLGGSFGRAIRGRSVVLVSARDHEAAQSAAARQALSDLAGTLTSLRELGLRGDCLAWVTGCEAADASCLSGLLSLGHATGTAVLLSTTSPGLAGDLAADAGLVVASGPVTGNLAQRLTDLVAGDSAFARPLRHQRPSAGESLAGAVAVGNFLHSQRRGSATMIANGTILGNGSFLTVPIDVTKIR